LGFFVASRLLQAIPLVLVVILVNFALIRLAPGDPATLYIGEGVATQERLDRVRADLGLDEPPLAQITSYVGQVARLDLGDSSRYNEPVLEIIAGRLPATILLAGTGFLLSSVLGVLLAANAARRDSRRRDRVFNGFAMAGYAMPPFVIGQVLLLVFALWLGWLPASGMTSVDAGDSFAAQAVDVLRHLILPLAAYTAFPLALIYRMTRSGLYETMAADFVTTAHAEGLSRARIVYRHALPHALLSVIAVMGYNLGQVLAGSVLVETVFAWPGLGRLLAESILARDFPLILGIFTVTAVVIIVANTIADIVHALIDPRVAEGLTQ
jgi:peptide/nickel transport system permease protein